MTLKFDEIGCCRIHSVSDEDEEMATNERYVVMPWKEVTRHGKSGRFCPGSSLFYSLMLYKIGQ